MSSWFQFTVQIPESESESLSGLMFDMGSSGIEVDDAGEAIRLTAYFPDTVDRGEVGIRIGEAVLEIPAGQVIDGGSETPDEDWGAAWRTHFKPVYPTGRIVVYPPWETVTVPDGGFGLKIEPKTAFGTGSHATTKMALAGLERVVAEGDRVLDVGTGSGILSIAAIRLGASEALAIDTDPLATENVAENVALNGVAGISVETRGVTAADTGYDVTVANIIRSVLTPLLPLLAASVRPGGHVILGGLLGSEEDGFVPVVESTGLQVVHTTREAEWLGLITKASR